jgi:hypothetical protein
MNNKIVMNEEWEDRLYELINGNYDIEDLVGVCRMARRAGFVNGVEVGKKQSRWISVKDQLPNKNDLVFIVAFGEVRIGNYDEREKCWYNGILRLESSYVTHWMPFPEFNK